MRNRERRTHGDSAHPRVPICKERCDWFAAATSPLPPVASSSWNRVVRRMRPKNASLGWTAKRLAKVANTTRLLFTLPCSSRCVVRHRNTHAFVNEGSSHLRVRQRFTIVRLFQKRPPSSAPRFLETVSDRLSRRTPPSDQLNAERVAKQRTITSVDGKRE